MATRAAEAGAACPLCLRVIPPGTGTRYLVLKLEGGAKGETVMIHAVCHRMVHRTVSEGELAQDFSTFEALCAHEGCDGSGTGWGSDGRDGVDRQGDDLQLRLRTRCGS